MVTRERRKVKEKGKREKGKLLGRIAFGSIQLEMMMILLDTLITSIIIR